MVNPMRQQLEHVKPAIRVFCSAAIYLLPLSSDAMAALVAVEVLSAAGLLWSGLQISARLDAAFCKRSDQL